MDIPFDNMKEAAALMQLIADAKNSEDGQAILKNIDELAESLKPTLQAISRFSTQLEIDAIKQMLNAGLTADQAVALRCRKPDLLNIVGKAADGVRTRK